MVHKRGVIKLDSNSYKTNNEGEKGTTRDLFGIW